MGRAIVKGALVLLVFLGGGTACSQKAFRNVADRVSANKANQESNDKKEPTSEQNQEQNPVALDTGLVGAISNNNPIDDGSPDPYVAIGHLCSNRLTSLIQGNAKSFPGSLVVTILDSSGQNRLCERSGDDIKKAIFGEKKLLLPKDCRGLNLEKVRVRVVAKTNVVNVPTSDNLLFAQVFTSVVHSVEVPYKDLYPSSANLNRSAQIRLGLGGVGGNYTGWGVPGTSLTHKLYVLVGDNQADSCDYKDPAR